MEHPGTVDQQAERLFRSARRSDRLWPMALLVLCLYLASSCWSFSRTFGGTGRTAVVQALPNLWVPLLVVGIVAGARVLSRLSEEAGSSPFWWPRQARRVLIGLAFALPVLLFAVAPAVAIMDVDSGSTSASIADWLIRVSVQVR